MLTKIKAGHTEHKWFLGALKKCDKNAEKFVILVVELGSVFPPELLTSMDRTPLQSSAPHLSYILIVAGEVLHALVHLLHQEGDVLLDVLVLKLPLLQQLQLLHHLALHHRDAVLFLHFSLLRLLNQISSGVVCKQCSVVNRKQPEDGQDNPRDFLLLCITEYIS